MDIVMPKMGESVNEGTIIKWHKKVGDPVKEDEIIFEISTDKVDTEIPSPTAGVLKEIKHKEGDTVEVGTVVAIIDNNGEVRSEEKVESKKEEEIEEEKVVEEKPVKVEKSSVESKVSEPADISAPPLSMIFPLLTRGFTRSSQSSLRYFRHSLYVFTAPPCRIQF